MPDQRLVKRLHRLVDQGNTLTAALLAHMGEVDRRRLYLQAACPSMFAYCTGVLRMSEAQAYKHIRAARLAREFPAVLSMVHGGQIHLCALGLLAPHMTGDNSDELLQQAARKTKRQVEKLVASLFPSPPVPDRVRKLPKRSTKQGASVDTPASEPLLRCAPVQPPAAPVPAAATEPPPASKPPAERSATSGPATPMTNLTPTVDVCQSAPPKPRGRTTPLSAHAYKIEFTAGQPLHDKLRQAQELLRTCVPDGDLAAVFERALDALLPRLRKQRFAEVSQPRKSTRKPPTGERPNKEQAHGAKQQAGDREGASTRAAARSSGEAAKRSRHIPAEVKRQVAERDGYQCTYTDATGRRCPERGLVEFHHVHPFGKDGAHEVSNVKMLCRAHNTEAARHDYGEQVMERWRNQRANGASSSTRPGASRQPPGTAATDSAASQRKTRDTG